MNNLELEKMANEIRKDIVTAVHSAKSGHPGGSLSSADLFTYLYLSLIHILSLAASKREKAVPYYVLKPVFEDKVSYIPVEHHRVVLRDLFTREEALKLKETEQYKNAKHLRQAVDYVLDKVAIK